MKILRNIPALLLVAAMACACSENEYKVYDTTQKDSVFYDYYNSKNQPDSVFDYAFAFNIADHYTVTIPVSVMGSIKDYDRTVDVRIDPDSSTMAEGTNFRVAEAKVPAGSSEGVVKIDLLRGKDPRILQGEVKGRFIIGENDDLRSVKGSAFTITYSDVLPERPIWLLTYGTWPVYSYENYQLWFDYFHRLGPEADVDVYNEIVTTYGSYFENATNIQGPLTMYEMFLRNYVSIPLHRDHPEIEFISNPEW